MRITNVAATLFTAHALAAPTHYQPPALPNNATEAAPYIGQEFTQPSSSVGKLEELLTSLTSSTLSILAGSTTTMLGYAICGLTVSAENWETCTDYAVIAGSCVGISHLVIWKFPQVMNDLHVYETTTRSWEDLPAWGPNELLDLGLEAKPTKSNE